MLLFDELRYEKKLN